MLTANDMTLSDTKPAAILKVSPLTLLAVCLIVAMVLLALPIRLPVGGNYWDIIVYFDAAIALIRNSEAQGGRTHVTGIGKPEHVAHYGAALFASTGTPATFLHATEVLHGSAGQVAPGDVIVAVSNSGETQEIRAAVEAVRRMRARVVAITGNPDSWLAHNADVVIDAGVAREGGALGLAPRASVAAEILVLAALAAGLEREKGFTKADYNLRHPAGKLGERTR